MIQLRTWLDVADNSGAKRCHTIKVVGRGNKSTAEIGDVVVASVRKARLAPQTSGVKISSTAASKLMEEN